MPPLKIGVLLDGTTVAYWQYLILEQLQANPHTDLVLAVINQSPPQKPPGWGHYWQLRKKVIWKIHETLDKKLFPVHVAAHRRCDINDGLKDLAVMHVVPRKTKFFDFLEPAACAAIQAYQLDVVIRFGFRIIQGDFLKIANYGIWSFHHADNRVNRGGPPAYWELFTDERKTGITLQILNADLDGGLVIGRALCGHQGISIYRNRNNVFLRSVPMVAEKLTELAQLGWDAFAEKYQTKTPQVYSHPLYQTPDNGPAMRNLWKTIKKGSQASLKRIFYKNQWFLLIHQGSSSAATLRKFKTLEPPKHEYWADPFLVSHENRLFVFFEAVPYQSFKGYIAVVEYSNNKWHNFQEVLRLEHHLSFPFIFEWQNQWFMLPEAAETGCLQFYSCHHFPADWRPVGTAAPITGIDSVLYHHEGLWYLFTTQQEVAGAATNEVLTLWYAVDFLTGNWQIHPQSPLFRDITKGRMAGRIFQHKGALYRPAQDGSKGYGGALGIYKITELSPTAYAEEWVTTIAPEWKPQLTKVHTWNVYEQATVADAMQLKPRFW
jgi:hypothetical protein